MEMVCKTKDIIEAYDHAESEYLFWEKMMTQYGWNADNAIAAAQYYGQMNAIATWAFVSNDDRRLLDRLEDFRPRLYKEDYEEGS